jgi:hypothetical protein
MGEQVVKSNLFVPIIRWRGEGVVCSRDWFFLVGGPSSSAWSSGSIPGTGCMVPQPFTIGGNRSYLEFWDVTGNPRYPGY